MRGEVAGAADRIGIPADAKTVALVHALGVGLSVLNLALGRLEPAAQGGRRDGDALQASCRRQIQPLTESTTMTAWLDNLIPLKSRLNHLQLAGWQPAKVADQGLGCRLLANVMIPMKDGTKLSADVYLPRKPGRYPAIVQFSAYNRDLHTMAYPKAPTRSARRRSSPTAATPRWS